MQRGGDLTEERAVLRKGPQEYHSAPIESGRTNRMSQSIPVHDHQVGDREELTGDPNSGVMESLNGAVGVGQIATGKDAGHAGGGSGLAITIITIIFTEIFHWRHGERSLKMPDWLISRLFFKSGTAAKRGMTAGIGGAKARSATPVVAESRMCGVLSTGSNRNRGYPFVWVTANLLRLSSLPRSVSGNKMREKVRGGQKLKEERAT